ncbi:MAG: amidohydrolase [Bryobacterales bacterium]|nr:amidohydrolase [Bryobacterales bacterium]
MQTPWGDFPVRDAHIHFFSHRFFSLLTGGRDVDAVARQLEWDAPAPDPGILADRWVAELDRHGVASASLIASMPSDEASVSAALSRYPDRFHGQFLVNPLAPDTLERVAAAFHAGHRTVCLFPAMHRYSVADERLEGLWPLAAGRNVFVHCGVLSVGVRKKLGLPSPFDMRYSNPLDLHNIALRHPSVRFVVPHFGAGFFREALMLAGLCPNVYLDTSSSNNWTRFNEVPLDLETVFRRALDVAGEKRLLFGTDSSFFPRGWVQPVFSAQVDVLQRIGIGRAGAEAILGGNLLSLQG